jgi:hypothetical protein
MVMQNNLLVSPSKITLYRADTVNNVKSTLNIEERVISIDEIRVWKLSLLNFENIYNNTINNNIEMGFLVDIPIRRINARSDRKLLINILSLSMLTSEVKLIIYKFIVM